MLIRKKGVAKATPLFCGQEEAIGYLSSELFQLTIFLLVHI